MRLIAIETSGLYGGIALADGSRIIDEVRLTEGLRHARDLLVVVRDACLRAGWDPRGIEAVAVSIGPGSFTGLRIAVTFAKIVAWDTGAKVVTVPTLHALAENAPPDRSHVATVLDAKRYGLYASIFERRGIPAQGGGEIHLARSERPGETCLAPTKATPEMSELFGPTCITPEDLAARLPADAYILGRGITVAQGALSRFDLAPESLWDVRPSVVARMGFEKLACGPSTSSPSTSSGQAGQALADPMRLEPVYLRKPDAEEIWERKNAT